MSKALKNFTVIDSVYGPFIVNRHCDFQAESLIKTGKTHIEGELQGMRAILKTLPEKSVVVDGGANIGFVAVPVAHEIKAKKGVVYAFEPQRMLFNALAGTIALNELDNLLVFNMALGADKGTAHLPKIDYGAKKDFGMVQLSQSKEGEMVAVITVDSLNLDRLDFFKLDVEGYEIPALQGAAKTIKKHQPWCWVEYWKVGQDKIIQCFKSLDYKFYEIDKLNMLCAPVSRLKSSKLNINAKEIV